MCCWRKIVGISLRQHNNVNEIVKNGLTVRLRIEISFSHYHPNLTTFERFVSNGIGSEVRNQLKGHCYGSRQWFCRKGFQAMHDSHTDDNAATNP